MNEYHRIDNATVVKHSLKTKQNKIKTHQHKPVQQTSDRLQASCLMPELKNGESKHEAFLF